MRDNTFPPRLPYGCLSGNLFRESAWQCYLITYVAQHCGFSSRTYFQKKFKEVVGVPPGEYVNTL